jgi:hypothetical protein
MSSATSNATATDLRRYTVWVNGRTLSDSADGVLEQIRRNAQADSALRDLTLDQYVATLIDNAPYFFPGGSVPELLASQQYPSRFDQALEFLAAMPSSGVHILSRQ